MTATLTDCFTELLGDRRGSGRLTPTDRLDVAHTAVYEMVRTNPDGLTASEITVRLGHISGLRANITGVFDVLDGLAREGFVHYESEGWVV